MDPYRQFLERKIKMAPSAGFEVADSDIHPLLKPHQRAAVKWACLGGRRALFEAFGLGKSIQQLEILRLARAYAGGAALIVLPLGVRQEFRHDAEMLGIATRFIRSNDEIEPDFNGIHLTNYESVRDGKIDPNLFTAASLDEASVLRSFGSKTYQTFLTLFDAVRFRFVATATPSPNRYKELIHYAGFLGIMDTGQALTRWFKRDSTKANNLTLYPAKEHEFWLWIASWALFLQRPSDLCNCPCHKENTSKVSASESSSSSGGRRKSNATEHGNVGATADELITQPAITSPPAESSVADACAQSTVAKGAGYTGSGKGCSTGVATPDTRTGPITVAAGSASASDGIHSPTSTPTWETRQQEQPSTGLTTAETTNQKTAAGQIEHSKQETVEFAQATRIETEMAEAASRRTCCDECRCDDGYELPPITVHYVEVKVDHSGAPADRDGQNNLFRDAALGVQNAAREKRDTLPARVEATREIVAAHPDSHWLVWHDLEAERHAIQAAIPDAVSIYGEQDLDDREQAVIDFSEGRTRILSAKPVIAGSGCNFQRHCHRAVYAGIGFRFNDFIQSLHRIQRFLQTKPVEVWIVYAESEREVLATLKAKWARHEEMVARMSQIIREYGLSHAAMAGSLQRSIGVERVEASGNGWLVANNDCVAETFAMESDSVDLVVTSIPFANHYEYSPSYNDYGHTDSNGHFWEQMDFLTPELLRVLKPGRVACIHVKDRIQFGNVTGAGIPTVSPFHAEAIFHYLSHGFDYLGLITVVTDVVRENNQTYRLGWSEQCKDGTKMGVGSPEYIVLLHKPQTDRARGYADEPVRKDKADYTRARWQVDAHAFWRSSGNRLLTADDLAGLGPDQLSKLFTKYSLENIYDFETHVRIGEQLETRGALPATFMSLAPGSHDPMVWHDVNRMLTLNGEQTRRGLENHICPLQFDIVDRLIERYSNRGELVFDPFGGLFTVPYRALKLHRRGRAVELSASYFTDGVKYLQAAEMEMSMPSLFDLLPEQEVRAA